MAFQGNFSHGTQQLFPSRQDSSILSTRVANHNTEFDSACQFAEQALQLKKNIVKRKRLEIILSEESFEPLVNKETFLFEKTIALNITNRKQMGDADQNNLHWSISICHISRIVSLPANTFNCKKCNVIRMLCLVHSGMNTLDYSTVQKGNVMLSVLL